MLARALAPILALSLLALPAAEAHAQEQSARDDVDESFAIDDQAHMVALLYGLGFTLIGFGVSGFIGASIAAADAEGNPLDPSMPEGPRRTFWDGSTEGMFIAFGATVGVGVGLAIIGAVLDADAHARRDRLEERREDRRRASAGLHLDVSLAAGADGGGLALRGTF